MILHSLKLQNIRSYTSQTIDFPEGSLLLSGDIGSGKSTILLAIEFALFGILRGSSSGSDILRNGSQEGFVELKATINNQDIVIKRGLKRTKTSIAQTSGYIIQNDLKKEGTPIELKAWIIELLGYPKEFISKSKSLIYRYTVYTPQDDMKAILFEEKELRLDTLRKVFGIDKYKRIRENALTYTKELKTRIREFQVMLNDYDFKKKQHDSLKKEQASIEQRINETKAKLDQAKQQTLLHKQKASEHEETVKVYNQLKQELALLDTKLKDRIALSSRNKQELDELDRTIQKLTVILQDQSIESFGEELLRKKQELKDIESKLITSTKNLSIINQRIEHAQHLKEKISKIDNCPVCLQEVNQSHKDEIADRENITITDLNKQFVESKETDVKIKDRITKLNEELELLRKKEAKVAVLQVQKKQLQENTLRKQKLEEESSSLKKDVGTINVKRMELTPKIDSMKTIEQQFNESRKMYDESLKKERLQEVQHVSLTKESEGIQKRIEELLKELQKMQTAQDSLKKSKQFLHWIEEAFLNLMIVMEKHVMMSVYSEFNELFIKWFNMLIEDETIQVRLDDEFTPVVIQNGYESDINSLSGGEKTSLALAYRLALNKVINDMMDTIKTKDIIILDEPTEGFSTEQLDKIRDVLDELNITQIIIVSHESKIESYVDNVLKIAKDEHISRII